jgi:nucleoside-diphosphate-sugar epimerase
MDDPLQRCPDISRAKSILDWSPSAALEEMLVDIHRWLANNRAQLEPMLKSDGT